MGGDLTTFWFSGTSKTPGNDWITLNGTPELLTVFDDLNPCFNPFWMDRFDEEAKDWFDEEAPAAFVCKVGPDLIIFAGSGTAIFSWAGTLSLSTTSALVATLWFLPLSLLPLLLFLLVFTSFVTVQLFGILYSEKVGACNLKIKPRGVLDRFHDTLI